MRLSPTVPASSGDERDVFTGWRKVVARYSRAGQTSKVKRRYRRRVRRTERDDVIERITDAD